MQYLPDDRMLPILFTWNLYSDDVFLKSDFQ